VPCWLVRSVPVDATLSAVRSWGDGPRGRSEQRGVWVQSTGATSEASVCGDAADTTHAATARAALGEAAKELLSRMLKVERG
jgi:hypothetical protein